MASLSAVRTTMVDSDFEALSDLVPNLPAIVAAFHVGGFLPHQVTVDRSFPGSLYPTQYGTATITFTCHIPPMLSLKEIKVPAEPYYKQRGRMRVTGWGYKAKFPEDDDEYEDVERDYPYTERSNYSYDSEMYDTDPGDEHNDWDSGM